MAASTGVDNWNKNWKGSDRPTIIKKPSPYYNYNDNRSLGFLPQGTSVTYIDSLSESHTRVAIKYGDSIFYTNVDNLVKPRSLGVVPLAPQDFGVSGVQYTVGNYVSLVKTNITNRQDITGDLQTYLLDLVQYVDTGSASFDGYDLRELPLADIIKYFGEVLGPIACVKRGLLTKFGIVPTTSWKILIPSSRTEPLVDYYLISPDGKRIPISAKSAGTSNPLKVDIIVSKIKQSPTLLRKYQNSTEFKILDAIVNNTMLDAPFVGAMILGQITDQAAALGIALSGGVVQNKTPFNSLIRGDSRLNSLPRGTNPTAMNLSYVCEKKIVEYSRVNSAKFTDMIKDTLAEELVFVKLSITPSTKQPQFTSLKAEGSYGIGLVKLRSKNGYEAKSDKLGFQL